MDEVQRRNIRAILAQALLAPVRRTFAEALMEIPDVGIDSDFARIQENDGGHGRNVFD